MRTAVFDLDGTLVDTSRDMLAAANVAFEACGHPAPLEHPRHAAVAMTGGRAMLEIGARELGFEWDDAAYKVAFRIFISAYSDDLHGRSVIYPGVERSLDALARGGWALSVCTNKPAGLAERLLQTLGLRSRFGALVGADTLPVRKPDPKPLFEAINRVDGALSRAVLIGDTITDRKTAAAAGVPCVLVTFGPAGDAVAELEPEALLGGYDELEQVLARLVP